MDLQNLWIKGIKDRTSLHFHWINIYINIRASNYIWLSFSSKNSLWSDSLWKIMTFTFCPHNVALGYFCCGWLYSECHTEQQLNKKRKTSSWKCFILSCWFRVTPVLCKTKDPGVVTSSCWGKLQTLTGLCVHHCCLSSSLRVLNVSAGQWSESGPSVSLRICNWWVCWGGID